jgi:hypothetical protein
MSRTVQDIPRTIRMETATREPGGSTKPGGLRELAGIVETRRSKVPNVRRVRESEIRDMPRIAMWPARSDDMKVLFLSNLYRQVPPKRLYVKPNTVLKSERAAHKT